MGFCGYLSGLFVFQGNFFYEFQHGFRAAGIDLITAVFLNGICKSCSDKALDSGRAVICGDRDADSELFVAGNICEVGFIFGSHDQFYIFTIFNQSFGKRI